MLTIRNSHKKTSFSFLAFLSLLLVIGSFAFGTSRISASNTVQKFLQENLSSTDLQNTELFNSFSQPEFFGFLSNNVKNLNNSNLEPDSIFVVNHNGDSNDVLPGNGVCADSSGNCTLRAAIQESNATTAIDEITFNLTTPAMIQLSSDLSPADLVISQAVTITGPGARFLTVNGNVNTTSGIFNITAAATAAININGITLANSGGHGINNNGILNLSDVTVRGSRLGIYNTSRLNLSRVLINNNTSGGIYLTAASVADISNTTITNNASTDFGGGIHSLSKDVTLNNVTISHNTAATSGGGFYYNNSAAGVNVRNTIIANNAAPGGPDIFAVNTATGANFISRGNNLIGKSAANIGFADAVNNDKVGTLAVPTDPLLGLLQNNGGQTDTRNLGALSPAKNAGNACITNLSCPLNNPSVALTTDQRGTDHPRIFESVVDIGAFESFYPVPVISSFVPTNWGTGRGTFELTINGSKFVADSAVKWNGLNRATTFVSNTQLKAQILASDVTAVGQFPVTVTNPSPGGGASAPVNFTVADCSYSISTTSQTFTFAGGNGGTNIIAPGGCTWTAVSNAPWITVTGNSNGTGAGTISFTVAANNGSARIGTLTIAGQTFTVNQSDGCTYSISPTNASAPAAGLSSSFNITTSNSGCTWTAVSNAPWITVTNNSGTGPGTINYTVSANTASARIGTITINGQTFTVNQSPGCAYLLTPNNAPFGAAGGTGNFNVAAGTGCNWTATSNVPWLTVNTGTSGSGNGTVSFTVTANTGPLRTGIITVNGQTFTVTQTSGCTYTLSSSGTSFNAGGGSGSFSVTTNNSTCSWTAVTTDFWITINSGAAQTGNGAVSFTVAANVNPNRTGTINVNGQTFTINQSNGCFYTISPTNATAPAGGTTGSFNLNAGASCPWTVVSNDAWISITSSLTGTGSSVITFSAAANNGPARNGTITVGGQTFTISQANGCAYALSSISTNVSAGGGTGSVTVTASNAGCQWTATIAPNTLWITITGGSSGMGNGTVNFQVAANTGPMRSGTLTIAGLTFTINQANGCVYSLSSNSTNINEDGGIRSFDVITNTGCTWTAISNNPSFITITAGAGGNGNGTVTFSVAANTGNERIGTITVNGLIFTVNQINLKVTNLNDSGVGSLRTAVMNANNTSGDDIITFQNALQGVISLTSGEIVIANNGKLEIRGPGTFALRISGNNISRIFYTDTATVTIKDITLFGGNGIGIGSTESNPSGGAIFAKQGMLTLDRVQVLGNILSSGNSGVGGGVYLDGGTNHSIRNSLFYNNRCSFGGGIYNQFNTLSVVNTTLSGNIAGKQGGAIYSVGTTTLRNVTITENKSLSSIPKGGGIIIEGGEFNIGNSIVAGNTGPELTFNGGGITSAGNNLIGDAVGDSNDTQNPVIYQTTDILDRTPRLAPLAVYGGTTTTHALLPGSLAINNGNNANAPLTDQRGSTRIVDGTIDIGAFEYNVPLSPADSVLPNGTIDTYYSQSITASRMSGTASTGSFAFAVIDGSLPSGLSVSQTGLLQGIPTSGGVYTFTVQATDTDGMSGANTYTLSVGCSYSINAVSQSFNSAAGNGTVNVTSITGCPWTAVSNASWITVISGSPGNGSGTLQFAIAANTGLARSRTLTIAGQIFTVNQAGGCTFSINPPNQSFNASAGTGSFAVSSGCAWNAVSNTPWITITGGAAGTGSGTVNYTVTANSGSQRNGSITVGGQTFFVTQAGGCTYTLSAPGADIVIDGGTGSFAVNSSTGCLWTAAASNSWITITSGSGSGGGTVSFSIRANSGAIRSGTIVVGGQTFTVNQAGATNSRTAFDFDGDGKADISVFRPSNGIWYLLNSQTGFGGLQFGASGDKLVPGDYDGDGRTDVAVYRGGAWYIQRSTLGFTNIQFGEANDIPVPGDFDADGKTDVAVYRPSNGTWFLQRSTLGFIGQQFGQTGDKPIAADFDGDGKADLAVFRPSNGIWYIQQSTAGFTGVQFGDANDKPVAADYDGDGKTDVAVYRPSNGFWYLNLSLTGYTGIQFGISTDVPVPADYDGDGKTDLAVFRSDTWYLQRSTAGFTGVGFGISTDAPVPNAYVP